MAGEYHTPVPILRTQLTATDFLMARLYYQIKDENERKSEWKDLHRIDWYLAVIAHQVYQLKMVVAGMFSKTRLKVDLTVNDFLLHRPLAKKGKKLHPLSPEELEQKRLTDAEAVKTRWMGALGMTIPPKPEK